MSYYYSFSTTLFISVVAFATLLPSPTLSTTLVANITGINGEYYAHLLIGTPPTLGSLVLDTDSDLLWTHHCPKSSASYLGLPCNSDLCKKVNEGCDKTKKDVCQYKYLSTNLTTFPVDLATETFYFGDTSVPNLGLSCGALENLTGGLGLGHGPLSLVSQTNASAFSYCLPEYDNPDKKGFLLVGSPSKSNHHPNMIFTTLLINQRMPSRYYISVTGISVNKVQLINIPATAFQMNETTGAGGFIMDTGTTVTHLNKHIYGPLMNEIKRTITLKPTSSPKGVDLNNCFTIPSNDSYMLPRITFHFSHSSKLTLSPANTFRVYTDPITKQNVSCLAMAMSRASDKGVSRFGNMQQHNTLVFFNLAKQTVGFRPNLPCETISNH